MDERKWSPIGGPELPWIELLEDVPMTPVRTPVNRNGLPEHRPYVSPPGTPRFDGFSKSCKGARHASCRQECGCFCHG